MDFAFLIPIFGILIVLVPIIGLTTVLTLRFGLKPFMESIDSRGPRDGDSRRLQAQVEDLSEQVALMAAELQRLGETQAFDQQLLERAAPKGGEE